MKTFNLYIITVLAATLLLASGCAKEKKSSSPNNPVVVDPVTPVTPDDDSTGGTTASKVDLTPVSFSNFYEYAQRTLNNPSNLKVKVNLRDIGNGRYAGELNISYYDNGKYYDGVFKTGESVNEISYQDTYRGKPDSEFNQWFTWQGKQVFHAFFQDKLGAIVLVIDKTDGLDSGDGAGFEITNVSGKVYYKNFLRTPAEMSGERCWFVMKVGSPYYCATFLNSQGIVDTKSALYPSNGYKVLGSFSGMNKAAAFNE